MIEMNFEIVPMTAAHIPDLAEIERESFSDPWSEQSFTDCMALDHIRFIVAVAEGTVAGYVGAYFLDRVYICNVAVKPGFRRRGVAERLLRTMIDLALETGISEITLEARTSNAPARALYEKLGFVRVGTHPHYYRHPTEDAEVYTLYLA